MKLLLVILIIIINIINIKCNNLVGLEIDTTSTTIKTFNYDSTKSNPLPGNKVIKLKGAQPFRVSAYEESYIVSAVRGSDYYVVLMNTDQYNQGTYLYGVNLETNQLFINGYSPNKDLLYIYGLTYNIKSDQLVAVSSMNYDALESLFDVVLLDPKSGEITKNLTIGNSYPNNTWYSGLYTSSESLGQIYILYQSMNSQNNTINGFTTISAIDGTFISNTWLNSNNSFVYSFVFDESTSSILATFSDYDGKNLQFASINLSNGDITTINKNSDQVVAGSGPVVMSDGTLLSFGKEPKPSHELYLVNTASGQIIKSYLNILMSGVSYLNSF